MRVLRRPALWLALASIFLVLVFVYWDRGRVSPGPLSAVHQNDPAIEEAGCDACHGTGASGFQSACTKCHADIGQQIAESHGLHAAVENVSRCGRCHSEHHGAEFALVGPQTFALAGIVDRARDAHAHVEFRLTGRHTTLSCDACHPQADAAVLSKGEKRFLGLDQTCTRCHEDAHGGTLPDCASCHGQEHPFAQVATFQHTDAFALAGSHAGIACERCHEPASTFAVANETRTPVRPVRGCEACHASPHSRTFVESDPRGCVACHHADHRSFAGSEVVFTRANHAITGFSLDAPHDRATCADCHGPVPRFAARRAEDCAACHADPHAGQFEGRAVAARGCVSCHATHGFAPPRFDVVAHADTTFPLTHSHAAVACNECHLVRNENAARTFHGTSAACSSCHADVHDGKFGGTSCSECHTTIAFDAPLTTPFDHARWTRFALVGAHARASCESCHPRAATADASGRRFGRASAPAARATCASCHADAHAGKFEGTACDACHTQERFDERSVPFDHASRAGFALDGAHARAACTACHPQSHARDELGRRFGRSKATAAAAREDCRSCHVDPHHGAFDRADLPASIEHRSGCLRCHTTESFGEIPPPGFDHARWTSFALEGAHSALSCASCHVPAVGANGLVRRFAPAAGTDCAACHVDPHAGQFARDGSTNCSQCHGSATSFAATRFDHRRDARFALDATHAKLACSACHLATPLPGGASAVRYKPLGTSCSDCHDARKERSPH